MAAPDRDAPLRELATQLLTLKITVVLSDDLGGSPDSFDFATARSSLHETWIRYRDEHTRSRSESSGPRRSDPSDPRSSEEPDFAELAAWARETLAEMAELDETDERDTTRAASTSDDHRSASESKSRVNGAGRAASELDRSVVQRIATMSERLATPPTTPVAELEHRLLVAKATALHTDPVLLETQIHVSGDVTTRINRHWLDSGHDREQRMDAVLALQRMGVETSVTWWSKLVDLVADAGRTLLELALSR